MASFPAPNSPKNLTMLDMRAKMDMLGGPAKQCRFAIRILPAGSGQDGQGHFLTKLGYTNVLNDITYLCESISFPGRGFDFTESRYYGPPQYLPYNSKYSNEMTLTLLTRADGLERQLFDDWLEIINPTNTFDFNYATDYYSHIQVYQLKEIPGRASGNPPTAPDPSYMWQLLQCWPISVGEQAVTWADNDVLRLQITFTYRYWVRPGRDEMPGGGYRPLS